MSYYVYETSDERMTVFFNQYGWTSVSFKKPGYQIGGVTLQNEMLWGLIEENSVSYFFLINSSGTWKVPISKFEKSNLSIIMKSIKYCGGSHNAFLEGFDRRKVPFEFPFPVGLDLCFNAILHYKALLGAQQVIRVHRTNYEKNHVTLVRAYSHDDPPLIFEYREETIRNAARRTIYVGDKRLDFTFSLTKPENAEEKTVLRDTNRICYHLGKMYVIKNSS